MFVNSVKDVVVSAGLVLQWYVGLSAEQLQFTPKSPQTNATAANTLQTNDYKSLFASMEEEID